MADFPAPERTTLTTSSEAPTTAALIAYLLFGVAGVTQIASSGIVVPAPLLTIIGIVGVIIAYVKRADARGTWLESHMTWLIRTFWWSTIWAVIGWIVFVVLFLVVFIGVVLGALIWAVTAIWVIYRVIKGIVYFKDQRPIPL